jgi:hypothetical protein
VAIKSNILRKNNIINKIKITDVSEEYNVSIFGDEEYTCQDTRLKEGCKKGP